MQYDEDFEFQRSLIAAAWSDEKFLMAGAEVLKPSFFGNEILGAVVSVLLSFVQKNSKVPDLGACLSEIKVEVAPGRKYGEYEEEVRTIWARRGGNVEYYKQKAIEFARTQAVISAVEEAHKQVTVGDFEGVLSLVTKAVRTGEHAFNGRYDFFKGTKDRILTYLGKDGRGKVHRVPTGILPLDSAIRGGLGPGELGVIEALPKCGKSTVLIHLGASALERGETVLHVSVENSLEVVAERYDVRLWGRPRKEIEGAPREFWNSMKEMKERLGRKLLISCHPTRTLTPAALGSAVSNCDPRPTVVIVDYADELRAPRKRSEQYEEIG